MPIRTGSEMAEGSQEALDSLQDQTSAMLNGLLRRVTEHSEDTEEILLDMYMKFGRTSRRTPKCEGACRRSW